jgi:hypothetical protein
MKSLRNVSDIPGGVPLLADDVLEFHASRLLLLLGLCGKRGRIEGLTKLAKLDFFVRYPVFFEEACEFLGKDFTHVTDTVDSSMVRYHYGPWDRRYYQVLAYLECRRLIAVERIGSSFEFGLTPDGAEIVDRLKDREAFQPLIVQMKQVKQVFGNRNGSSLKNLIYQVFDQEVAQREHGQVITHEH